MLTHTIRALSLLALIVVAHTLRPFSSNNVTVFAAQAVTSATRLLPEKTLERWLDFGSLAALVTGNSDPLARRFANSAALVRSDDLAPGKPVRQTAFANRAGRTGRRVERTASYQAGRPRHMGGVPLPFIPGLEVSLTSNPSLLTFPTLLTTEGFELPQHSFGALQVFGLQQQFNNFERSDETVSEESAWPLEPGLHKPLPAATPNMTFRRLAPFPHAASNAQACPQAATSTKGILSTKGQSC